MKILIKGRKEIVNNQEDNFYINESGEHELIDPYPYISAEVAVRYSDFYELSDIEIGKAFRTAMLTKE